MLVGDKELGGLFAGYTDEELLRILTVERATYRRDAHEAAGMELVRRGLPLPPSPTPKTARRAEPKSPEDDAPEGARPKSPYQLIDLLVDVLLVVITMWVVVTLEGLRLTPWGGLWDAAARTVLAVPVVVAEIYLHHRWRAIDWRD